jgi:hypothetical protein
MTKNLFFAKYFIFGAFVIGVLVIIFLRVLELLHAIDPVTGFYKTGSVVVPVLNVMLIALVIVLLLPFVFKNHLNSNAFTEKSKVNSIIAFLLGAALCIDTASQVHSFVKSADVGTFMIAITELFAAIFFFILSDQKLTGKKLSLAAPALLPVIWGIVTLGVSFMRYTSIANISEFLFDVLKMVFVLVFVYFNARIIGHVFNNNEGKGVISFGLTAALFCIISTVPRVIAWFIGPNTATMPGTGDLLYIVFAVYIIDVVAEALFKKHEFKEDMDMTDADIKLSNKDEQADKE